MYQKFITNINAETSLPHMNGLGILDLTTFSWKEAISLFSMMTGDGWEILAIKVYPEGVYAFVIERIIDLSEA